MPENKNESAVSKISLRQVEKSDFAAIRGIFESPLRRIVDLPNTQEMAFSDDGQHFYVITLHRGGSDVYIVGVCGFIKIDMVSRHAKILFVMVDKDKDCQASIQNHPSTKSAFEQFLKLAFDELGLNKVWIEIAETNKCLSALEDMGFVVEGVCRDAMFKQGRFVSSMVLSLTVAEYGAKK